MLWSHYWLGVLLVDACGTACVAITDQGVPFKRRKTAQEKKEAKARLEVLAVALYLRVCMVISSQWCRSTCRSTQARRNAPLIPNQPFQLTSRMPWIDKEVAPAKLTPEQQEFLDSVRKEQVHTYLLKSMQ